MLINKSSTSNNNPWNIEYHSMFHMTNDSGLFYDKEWLVEQGFVLNRGIFQKEDEKYLPLYEGKLFSIFDHRFGTFEGVPREKRFRMKAGSKEVSDSIKTNPLYEIEPRFWVHQRDVSAAYNNKNIKDPYVFVFRNACHPFSGSRTARSTIIPAYAASNGCPLLLFGIRDDQIRMRWMILFACVFNSFTFDFVVRQKMSTRNLNLYVLAQIAVPAPEKFCFQLSYRGKNETAEDWILQYAPSLFCNSDFMMPFARHFGVTDPVNWDPLERHKTTCFIDAIVAHVYGLSKEDYEYLLTRFPILRDQEIDKYGEFRSKRLCIEYFDSLIYCHCNHKFV